MILQKFKIFRDLLVRNRYEAILSRSIFDIILKNLQNKNNIKILDFGSGFEPTVTQLIKNKLLTKSITSTIHGYDLYDDYQLKNLNKNTSDRYFKSSDLTNTEEYYDFAIISDVLHHMDVDNTDLIYETLKTIKKKAKFIIIKDHFQYGFFSNQILRFMDFFGNFYNNIKTPKRYYQENEFNLLLDNLNLKIREKILNNRYHSRIFLFLSNPKYHFIYLLG